jgi:dystroglycan 1
LLSSTGNCIGDSIHHPEPGHPPKSDDIESPIINQDVLITYVLPTTIILLMLLIALLIACLLYKRRNTGKMELGDEEERKSFRSKGIPVIFQDELEEKPEIVTKSPIILKDEKPPLLPQYNGMSQDGEFAVDRGEFGEITR